MNENIKKKVYTDPFRKMLSKAVEFLKFKKGIREAIVDSFKPKINKKIELIIKTSKEQRLSLVNDLKMKHTNEVILMKKKVDELNKKMELAKKIYNEQKKKLAKSKGKKKDKKEQP